MPFKLNAYLPSKKQEVQIGELYYKQYRELVKSLYNTDKKETIQQYNSILQDLCSDIKDIDITIEDKLSLLLTIRNYCVSPDLKLKGTTKGGTTFNYSISVDKLIKLVNTINKSDTIQIDGITISFSSYKARDEYVLLSNNRDIFIILASCIDNIVIGEQTVIFKDLAFDERLQVVNSLPHTYTNKIYKAIKKLEKKYEAEDLLVVKDPVAKDIALRITKNITVETLQQLVEFNFTEDLNNIYRAFYNMVKYAGFDANYIDTITPVEMQVYWMYFMQDNEKQTSKKETSSLNTGSLNSELGF